MLPGSANLYHLAPKSRGGRETVLLHRICHDKIHATLSERELERGYASIEALRSHSEVRRFVRWVARRPAGFAGANKKPH